MSATPIDPVTAFIEYLAQASEGFAWSAGVGACETAGAIVSYLAKHPEKLTAFQRGGFFEMCPDPGTDLHREGRLSWMAKDGKVWTPEKVAAALAKKEAGDDEGSSTDCNDTGITLSAPRAFRASLCRA